MATTGKYNVAQWARSLRFRVTLLLSLAALPIGMIAVFQTNRLADTAFRNFELTRLALTEQAVQSERRVIQRALGAASMLGHFVPELTANPENCQPYLRDFLSNEPDLSFVGVLPKSGVMTCSTADSVLDFSSYDVWPDLVKNPRPSVVLNPAAPGSKTAVLVASMPYQIDGIFAGYISVSIPQAKLAERKAFANLPVSGLTELITINQTGQILTAERETDVANSFLPPASERSDLFDNQSQTFRADAINGNSYVYTVVPVTDSPLTIIGVWSPTGTEIGQGTEATIPTSVFPILMWIACVLVAIMALNTLVIRHINTLRKQMAGFALDRSVPDNELNSGKSTELAEIQSHFIDLTDDILREEARLESLVHEQKVLAKEVHHRVKNNLQMIASIMNMQIRNAEETETVETLERVQDRISALADVHKDLYTTEDEGRINVGALIERTVQNSVEVGIADVRKINLVKDIAHVWMFPDQVVPLSLLASEAVTNALKYMHSDGDEQPTLKIHLHQIGNDCELSVANSSSGVDPDTGTGIGAKLIRAFSIKLGAQSEISKTDGMYVLKVRFPIADFEVESLDY